MSALLQVSEDKWLIPTSCPSCYVEVGGWDNWSYLAILSGHAGTYRWGLWARIKDAWRSLRGRPEPAFELFTVDQVEAVREALRLAADHAFGRPTERIYHADGTPGFAEVPKL